MDKGSFETGFNGGIAVKILAVVLATVTTTLPPSSSLDGGMSDLPEGAGARRALLVRSLNACSVTGYLHARVVREGHLPRYCSIVILMILCFST